MKSLTKLSYALRSWEFLIFSLSYVFRQLCYHYADPVVLPNIPSLYVSALTDHFADYVWFHSLKPPLSIIIHKLLLPFSSLLVNPYLNFVFVINSLGMVILYNIMKLMKVSKWLSVPLILLVSFGYVPFEFNSVGVHYDEYTFILVCIFIYSLVSSLLHPPLNIPWKLSISSTLLVLQQPVYPFIVGAALLLSYICVFRYSNKNWVKSFVCTASLPLIAILILMLKAYMATGVLSTGTLGGSSLMTFVYSSNEWSADKVRRLAVEAGAPEWYLWCFDHNVPYKAQDGTSEHSWIALSKAYGICFDWSEGNPKFWPFNFEPFLKNLRDLKAPESVLNAVTQDLEDMTLNQYRMMGIAPEYTPRWMSHYGKISTQIYKHFLRNYPDEFFNGVRFNTYRLFLTGIVYLNDFSFLKKDSLKAQILSNVTLATNFFNRQLYDFFKVLLFVISFLVIFPGMKTRISNYIHPRELIVAWFICIIIVLLILPFTTAIAVENNRHFRQLIPYLLILTCWSLQQIVNFSQKLKLR